jgi:uncharacterized Tic20 family protein
MWCHLGSLSGFIGFPFGNIIVPAIIWLLRRNDHPFIDEHGRESMNFQVSLLIYSFIAGILCLLVIGFLLLAILYIFGLVCVIKAAMRANDGLPYRYPYTLRLFD